MASECCLSLTKYFLFLFNLMFFILGSLLLSLGLWILFSETIIFMPSPPYISISLFSYLLIISGSVTMFLGFLGCLGSLKAVKCLLAVYFILLSILLAGQIVGGVLYYTQKSEVKESLKKHTIDLMESYGNNQSSLQSSFLQTLEYIQKEAKCCGWDGESDWKNLEKRPCSCYNTTVNQTTEAPNPCFECFSNSSLLNHTCNIYKEGCGGHINKWLDENLLFILVVILSITVVECLQWICVISFFCLNRTHRCCPRESHGSHVQLSRDFTVEYWQDMWYDPFDVSV